MVTEANNEPPETFFPKLGFLLKLTDSLENFHPKHERNASGANELTHHIEKNSFFHDSFCRHDFKSATGEVCSKSSICKDNDDANVEADRDAEDGWGWYDDIEESTSHGVNDFHTQKDCSNSTPSQLPRIREVPSYVLTESLSAQKLWYETAGQRSPQPTEKRKMFENKWKENFKNSQVDYSRPLPEQENPRRKREKVVLYRKRSSYGSAVMKSFKCENCSEILSIVVNIPKFQVVKQGSDVHAEYLVVVGIGQAVAGIWRRFDDFKALANKLSRSEHREQFRMTLNSWAILRARRRFFRCLDKDYLNCKCFYLARFIHDLVFESASPGILREFLGVL